MNRKRFWKKIGFRLSFWYTLIFLFTAFCLLFVFHYLIRSLLTESDKASIESKANELALHYSAGGVEKVRNMSASQPEFFVRLADSGNRTIFTSHATDLLEDFDLSILQRQQPIGWLRIKERDEPEFEPWEAQEVLEIETRRLHDNSLIQVGKTSEQREESLAQFHLLFGIVLLPLFLIGGVLYVSRATRPLREMIATVREIQAGTLSNRVPVHNSGDEMDELGNLFNEMLGRIEKLIEGMRNSLDNVAHDLRTPAARLRSIAETALQSEPGGNGCREALADCLEESERILSMLNILMDISEAETGVMKLNYRPVDVSQLIRDTIDLYQYVAEDKGIGLFSNCVEDITLLGDRDRLRQVLANLVDNAIKFTERGGTVKLDCGRSDGYVLISVSDSGRGITEEHLPHIWDRLYRGSDTQKGLGLGLSLVKAIVKAHQGSIDVFSEIGKGTTFTVRFRAYIS